MKPTIFIGSSSEGLPVVAAATLQLSPVLEVVSWKDPATFGLSGDVLGSLIDVSRDADYGLFVLTPEDLIQIRKSVERVSRDNVILELGMFFGAVGRERCFYLLPTNVDNFHVPTDLAGITAATYKHVVGAVVPPALVEGACEKIKTTVTRHLQSGLSGLWTQTWSVDRPSGFTSNQSEAVLIALGPDVKGRWQAFDRTYCMQARREGSYLTGTWRDLTREGYSGAFQLKINATQTSMHGKWVGWSDTEHKIREGDWTWQRTPGTPAASAS